MINYDQYVNDDDFMTILQELRCNCLYSPDEVTDATDLSRDVVNRHYELAQAIVAEEIDHGVEYDPDGADVARGFMDFLSPR